MTKKLPHQERTLVLIKPDGVQRGIVGDIITRFEHKGLKIVGLKITVASEELAAKHYGSLLNDEWCKMAGAGVREAYEAHGLEFKWKDDLAAGIAARDNLIGFMACGPMVAMILEGADAIKHVRNMVGFRDPVKADAGTIRADFTVDSALVACAADRAIHNVVHASGNVVEAEEEIALWFTGQELVNYKLVMADILYSPEWNNKRRALIMGE